MPGGARRHPAEPFLDPPDRLSVAPLVAQPVAAPEEVGGRREAWLHEDAQHSVEKSSQAHRLRCPPQPVPSQSAVRAARPELWRSYHAALPGLPNGDRRALGQFCLARSTQPSPRGPSRSARTATLRAPWPPSGNTPDASGCQGAREPRLTRNLRCARTNWPTTDSRPGPLRRVATARADYVPKEDPSDLGGVQSGVRWLLDDVVPRLEDIVSVSEPESRPRNGSSVIQDGQPRHEPPGDGPAACCRRGYQALSGEPARPAIARAGRRGLLISIVLAGR